METLKIEIASWEASGNGRTACGNIFLLLKETDHTNYMFKITAWDHETYNANGGGCSMFNEQREYFEEVYANLKNHKAINDRKGELVMKTYPGMNIKKFGVEGIEKLLKTKYEIRAEIIPLFFSNEKGKINVSKENRVMLIPATNGLDEEFFYPEIF